MRSARGGVGVEDMSNKGMMLVLGAALLLLLQAPLSLAGFGVDVSDATSTSAFQCMANNGISLAVVRCFRSSGEPDSNAQQSIENAHSAGISTVDVYMFPCPSCGNCGGQVQTAVGALNNNTASYRMFWLDIEGPQYWSDASSNQNCFQDMVSAASSAGLSLGVYTSASQWNPIMGSGYTGGSSYPLWYAHYDGAKDFSDFQPFGGWSSPTMKQYDGDTTMCGAGVDLNYF